MRGPQSRAEIRSLLALAGPVIGVQLGMMLMGTVDAMMLGRVSETAIAAGALGNAVGFGLLVFPMGLLMGLDPLVAQAFGAGESHRIQGHLWRGLAVAVLLSVPVSLVMVETRPLLALLGQKEPVLTPAAGYLRALIPGNVAFLIFVVLRQTLQAMGIVRPALIAIVAANVANVFANWGLVFGRFGLPRLEVVGSAYATSISRWLMVVLLLAAAWPALRPYLAAPGRAAVRVAAFRRLLGLGIPVGFQISLEIWLFAAVAVVMGSLGPQELAGHQIALNLAALAFMFPLGMAAAGATRVGNAIGRDDQAGARRAAVLSLSLGGGVMIISGILFATLPEQLARLYTPAPGAIEMAATLLPIAAAFQVADGTQVVGAGVLRGTADTRFPAVIALVGYWVVGLPGGLVLAFPLGLGPRGLWWGLTLGLACAATLLVARIRVRFRGTISRIEET